MLKVVVIAFIHENGHLLLNGRRGVDGVLSDTWELLGGGIEVGESPMDAIKREIQEELHYSLTEEKDNLVLVKTLQLRKEKFEAEIHYFTAKFPGLANFSDSSETRVSDLKLFSLTDANLLKLLPISKHIITTL